MQQLNLFTNHDSRSTNRDKSMRHIVAGAPALYTYRLCAGSRIGCARRASRAYSYLNVKVNATYCRTPLRGRRFAALVIMQRCCFSATYNSRLCARRFAARHPWIVQRCCAALHARFAGSGSCAAVAALSLSAPRVAVGGAALLRRPSRCAGRRPVSPLLRLDGGLRARHPRPCPALALNPYTILKVQRSSTPHPLNQ